MNLDKIEINIGRGQAILDVTKLPVGDDDVDAIVLQALLDSLEYQPNQQRFERTEYIIRHVYDNHEFTRRLYSQFPQFKPTGS